MINNNIFKLALVALTLIFTSCEQDPQLDVVFSVETESLEVGPDRSVQSLTVSSPNQMWVMEPSVSWITVAPANGIGTTLCDFTINTTQEAVSRTGYVRVNCFTDGVISDQKTIKVTQFGYAKEILVDIDQVTLENYGAYGERIFEIEVTANVEFDVVLEGETTSWLTVPSDFNPTLETGYTPKKFTLEMEWNTNSVPYGRDATITFVPRDDSEVLVTQHSVYVSQKAGDLIEPTPTGDSLALVAIARNMGCYDWPTEKIIYWSDVELWEATDEDVVTENIGRVKSVLFFMPSTNEAIPYEVSYLTAAETIMIRGNTNSQTKDLSMNNFWGSLTNLKYLEIMAYGIDELDESLLELGNTLETLDISCNNFLKVPEMVTRENFPALKEFRITASQLAYYYDLSNIIESYGEIGLEQDIAELTHFFEWDSLETLALGVNFLHGSIPAMEDYSPIYTQEIIDAADTLPDFLVGRPMVLPHVTELRLNLNRLTGDIPEWILYHPQLSLWDPGTLIFNQDGLNRDGEVTGFDNEPDDYDYYYNIYTYLAEKYDYFNWSDEEDETLVTK